MAEMQERSGQAQKAALWMMGVLMLVALAALAFLGGYVVRMQTNKTTSAAASPQQSANAPANAGAQGFGTLDEVYQILKDNYIDPTKLQNFDTLKESTITGLLNAIGDPNQVYVPPADVTSFLTDQSGQYEGIGAGVGQKNGQILIQSLTPDYPASKSHLRVGDILLTVDGKSVQGLTANAVVNVVRGPAGTSVTLGVQHQDGSKEDVTVNRAPIITVTTHTDQITDSTGAPVSDLAYLRLSQFQPNAVKEIATYLQSLQGKPIKGFILDLRNNPGGELNTTLNILSDFLQPGQTELIQQDRAGKEQVDKAQRASVSLPANIPMVVLVNKNSASASEVTSSALHDNKRATVIGEQTYGKGTVNRAFPLPKDGGLLYVSIENWLSPDRKQIEGVGITPDMVVHLGENDDVNSYQNAQLYRAIDFLRTGK